MNKNPTFAKNDADKYQTLRRKVDLFLKERDLTHKANGAMYAKTTFYLLLLLAAYGNLFTQNPIGWLVLWKYLALGIAAALSTMNISHDGLHGAYSSSKTLNRSLGYLMDLCGKSSYFWGKGHVVDHHTFTNVGGHDHDLMIENPFLRLCPGAKRRPQHRIQHLYAPILYALYPLLAQIQETWDTLKLDSIPLKIEIFSIRIIHYALFLALPMWYLQLSWPQLLLSYVCYGAGVGFTLTLVFQLAHIVENVAFPDHDDEGKLEDDFMTHQLKTTANFSTSSKVAHFLFGGLNYQVEHHLLPHVCHIHLHKLSPMIRAEVLKHGLPYHENPTAAKAVLSHFRALKRLGATPK